MLRRLITGLAVAAALGGCGAPAPAPNLPSSPSATAVAGARCRGAAEKGGHPVMFGPGRDLAGLTFGTATGSDAVGIVFAHEANDSACSWMRTAAAFAERGYRTLIFDFAGFGASRQLAATYDADVAAAADYLRSQGIARIVLIGASMGGTAAIIAAGAITPAVTGVVALSPPVAFGPMGALGTKLPDGLPVLLMAGKLDGQFPADARSLLASIGPADNRSLRVVDSSLHGFRLVAVDGSAPQESKTALDEFLSNIAASS